MFVGTWRPRPSAAVPPLLRLVVVPEKKLGLSCGLQHVDLELPHVSCDPVGAAGFNLSERAQARGTHAEGVGRGDPLYSFNSLLKAKQVVHLVVRQVPLAVSVGPMMCAVELTDRTG